MANWRLMCRAGACVLPLVTGCASLGPATRETAQAKLPVAQGKQLAVEQFEDRRDQAQFDAALFRLNQGDARSARELLAQLVHRSAGHREARVLLAELDLAAGNPIQAQQHLATIIADHPHDAHLVHLMGLALEASGQDAQAGEHFRRAVELAPETELFQLSLATAENVEIPDSVAPVAGGSRSQGGVVLASYTAAVPVTRGETLTATRPVVAPIATNEPAHQRAVAQVFAPSAVAAAAVAALRHNQPDHALQLLEPALARHPDDVRLLQIAAVTHYREGRFDASQVDLRQALSLDNQDALSYFLMGETLSRLGDRQGADWHRRRAEELANREPFQRRAIR